MVQRYKNLKVSDGMLDGYGTARTLIYAADLLNYLISASGKEGSSSLLTDFPALTTSRRRCTFKFIAGWTGVAPARSHKPNDGVFDSPSRNHFEDRDSAPGSIGIS